MSSSCSENFKAYPIRWYLLFLQCFFNASAAFQYCQFDPVYASFEYAFNWSVRMPELELLVVAFVILLGILPGALFLEKYGLRWNMLGFAGVTVASYGVRCIPWRNGKFQAALVCISSVLNGIAGALQAYLPLVLSARWFKPSERATATTIGITANTVGLIAAPLLTTQFIPDPKEENVTRHQVQDAYFRFTWVETGVVVVFAIAVLAYYPDQPPKPPSPSAADGNKKVDLKAAWRILRSPIFWLISIHYMMTAGGWFSWSPLMSIDLSNNGITQKPAAYVMAVTQAAGAVVSVLLARTADFFTKSLKPVIIAASILTLLGSLWLVLVSHNYLTFTLRQYYIASCILTGGAVAVFTLELELAAENLYPLDEAIVAGLLSILLNAVDVVFMIVLEFVSADNGWMDWYLLVSAAIGIIFAIALPNVYRRLTTDEDTGRGDNDKTN